MSHRSLACCASAGRASRGVAVSASAAFLGPAADEHLLVKAPRAPAILGHLPGPVEGVPGDVAEAPALGRVIIEPFQDDAVAFRPADEAADAPVEGVDPGRPPRRDGRIVKPQRRPAEGPKPCRWWPGGGHLPHV